MTPSEQFLGYLARIEQVSDVQEIVKLAGQMHYDGAVTVHFQNGVPKRVEVGRPVQIQVSSLGALTRAG